MSNRETIKQALGRDPSNAEIMRFHISREDAKREFKRYGVDWQIENNCFGWRTLAWSKFNDLVEELRDA